MGSELVSDSLPRYGGKSIKGSAPISYTDIFYKHLPFYLAIGMSFDQYWDGDCVLVKYYRTAHELKKQQRNQELWLQGMYIYEVLCDVSPILHAFPKKGAKPLPYASEPYPLTHKEIQEQQERKEKIHSEKMKAKMAAWAAKTNIQMAKNATEEVR